VVALVIVSQTAALLGDLVLAGIVDRHPTLLVALNPRNRNLVLATNQLSALSYYAIGFSRLVASDPLYYLLGYWFGDRAIAWAERRSRTYGPFIRDGERLFRQASYPLIFLAPNSIICALAAATGVRLRAFIMLNIGGTVARLILIRQLGEVFSSPLERVLGFIAEYRIPLLVLSAIGVAWTIFGEFRGDNSELNTLRQLDTEDDKAEAEAEQQAEVTDPSTDPTDDTPDGGGEANDTGTAEPPSTSVNPGVDRPEARRNGAATGQSTDETPHRPPEQQFD
jgi:hypothetical protein